MRIIKTILNIFLVMLIFSSPLFPQLSKVAQSGLQFLKVGTGARAAAMGGAMAEVSFDANAMFYNPAGIAHIEGVADAVFNSTQWIADIQYNSVAAAYTFSNIGTFGLSAIYADYGNDILGTMVANNEQGYISTGNLNVGAYDIGLSYAKNITEQFSIGGTVKYLYQHLGSNMMPDGTTKKNEVSGYGFDFGTIFYPGFKSFRFGISVNNFAKSFKYEQEEFSLPLTFTIGIAMNVLDLVDIPNQSLLIAVDATHPNDFSERMKLGAEYTFMNIFMGRVGYVTNNDIEGLSAGLGLKYDIAGLNVKVDYSYSDMNYFKGVNRFSVGFSF
jgi:hypothetical protein